MRASRSAGDRPSSYWECPDGAYCRDGFDRTARDGGAGTIARVCEPVTYSADVDCR